MLTIAAVVLVAFLRTQLSEGAQVLLALTFIGFFVADHPFWASALLVLLIFLFLIRLFLRR